MSHADAMEIVRECAESHGLTVEALRSRDRSWHKAEARAHACRELYAFPGVTMKRIAELVGYGAHHTMVVYWTTGRGRERFR